MIDTSLKAKRFTESVIRAMTRLCEVHGAINLAQGVPDFAAPREVKEAARRAIAADLNQYPITWGTASFRRAIAESYRKRFGLALDPAGEITVTCGSTEAMTASILALVDPGDEIVLFEPYQENYGPGAILAGATPRCVTLRPPDWDLDLEDLSAAFSEKTRVVVVNNPMNPTGKVFRREELEAIADQCRKWDAVALCDEVYEHIVFEGARHVPMATLPGMADRTVTVSGLSKSYAVTGWRVGWAIAPIGLTAGIRKVHDFVTVGAPAPFQEAGVVALELPEDYYAELADGYRARRDLLHEGLEDLGFRCRRPSGAFYLLADAAALGVSDDVAFARRLVVEARVGCVPGSSFWSDPDQGRSFVRFSFSKREETLREALRRLQDSLAN